MRKIAYTALFLLFSLPVAAMAADQRVGPGDIAPSIAAIDQTGEKQSLESLSGENGLVLAFIRSVDWCPFCQKQVRDLDARQNDFKALGYNVAALSYDPPEAAAVFNQKHKLSLPILSDQRSEIIDAFGLMNTEYPIGTRFYGIPHPAIYIIGPNGTITGYFAEEDYKLRPVLDDILASLAPEKPPAEEPADAATDTIPAN